MKRPLPGVTIAFCLGIFLAGKIRLSFLLFYISTVFAAIICLLCIKKGRLFSLLLIFLFFLLGISLLINTYILPKNHIAKLAPIKSKSVYIEGIIDSDPIDQLNRISFVLKAEKVKIQDNWQKVCGKVLVKTSKKKDLFYGDKIILEGRLYKPFPFRISERLKYKDYLRYKGIYVILSSRKNSILKKIKSQQGNLIVCFIFKIRHRLNYIVNKNLSNPAGSILNAVILGLRGDLPRQIRETLVNTGTAHIIAISGLHLGIIAFIVLISLKLIRIPRRPRYFIAIFILVVYCILTGSNVPVARATIMATILLLGYTIKRQVDIYNSLSLACLIILFINPWQLFEVSFQLSFLSIISLVWLSPKINSLFPANPKRSKYLKFLINIFSCSLAVWLGLFPLILYYFKVISPVTILANMFVVPYMSLIIACAFSFLLVGLIFPSLVFLFSPAAEISILFLLKFLSLLNLIPWGHFYLH